MIQERTEQLGWWQGRWRHGIGRQIVPRRCSARRAAKGIASVPPALPLCSTAAETLHPPDQAALVASRRPPALWRRLLHVWASALPCRRRPVARPGSQARTGTRHQRCPAPTGSAKLVSPVLTLAPHAGPSLLCSPPVAAQARPAPPGCRSACSAAAAAAHPAAGPAAGRCATVYAQRQPGVAGLQPGQRKAPSRQLHAGRDSDRHHSAGSPVVLGLRVQLPLLWPALRVVSVRNGMAGRACGAGGWPKAHTCSCPVHSCLRAPMLTT